MGLSHEMMIYLYIYICHLYLNLSYTRPVTKRWGFQRRQVLRFGEGPAAASGYATGRRQAGNVVKKGPNFSGEVFLIGLNSVPLNPMVNDHYPY